MTTYQTVSEDRATVTAAACTLPREAPEGVLPLSRWSCRALARKVAGKLPHRAISQSTIARWLRADRLRPWRFRLWQHIQDPARFLERARPVLAYYAQAQALLKEGVWLLCLDEKTSIQAREGEATPRAAHPERPMLVSARYRRRGARQLFAALSVAEGRIYGACRARKRFIDCKAFIEEVIVPEALRRQIKKLIVILDNGPTHAPKQFEAWLREHLAAWGIALEVCWLPVRASWLDQLEIWFSILQRGLLTPNHFGSVAELEQAIEDFIAHYNRTAQPIRWTYTVEKLEAKLGMH